jgi:S-adenosylmethionine hydrolase
MSTSANTTTPLVHLLCDFRVEAPDYTVAMARMASEFPHIKTLITPQPFKKGHVLGQSVFLKLVIDEFPEGTIHICRFGTMSKMPNRFVLIEHNNRFFMGPDNGLFPIYFGETDPVYYNITPDSSIRVVDALKQVYIPALHQLINHNMSIELAGFKVKEMLIRSSPPQPTLSNGMMRLTVIYNDYYGNAYLNIDKKTFEEIGQGRAFRLRLNSNIEINRLSESYNDVLEGMELCMFGYGNIMQIAVNAGSAAQYLSLNEDKAVILQFQE